MMNKPVVTAVFLLFLTGTAFSQTQLSIGLKGGLNYSQFDITDIGGSIKNNTGFHAGAFGLIKITKLAIQPEIIYSQQGSTVNFNGQDLQSNFDYVNIPILLKLYLIGGFNIQAGPQFGFLSSASGQVLGKDNSIVEVSESLYKNSDTSVAMGVGMDLPFGLTFDVRYNLGVSEINDDAALTATKNQVFQLSLGFKLIKLGK